MSPHLDETPGPGPADGPGRMSEAVARATRLVLGAVSVAGAARPGARRGAGPGTPADGPDPVDLLRLLPSAAVGVGLEAQRRALAAAAAGTGLVMPWVSAAARYLVPAGVTDTARRHLVNWSARGDAERRRAEEEAVAAGRALVRAVTVTVLDQLDLDAAVARVDVDRVADRVDVRRVADRIDLVALTEQVIAEIDIGRIVRDTSGGMAEETVDAFRARSMRADRLVNRATDRLLRRAGRVPLAPGRPEVADAGATPDDEPPRGQVP